MNKRYNEDHIIDALKGAQKRFSLSEVDKATMKFNVMDVINSGESRTIGHNITNNSRRFAMPIIPLILAAIFVAGSGTVVLADTAKPGDALYPVDLWAETIQARFATDNDAKVRLLANSNQERLTELVAVSNTSNTAAGDKLADSKAEALARLTANGERLEILRVKFEEKAQLAQDPRQKEKFLAISTRIAELQVQMENRMKSIEAQLAKIFAEGNIEIKTNKRWWEVGSKPLQANLKAEIEHEFKLDGGTASGSGSGQGKFDFKKGSAESDLKTLFKSRFDQDDKNDDNTVIKDGMEFSNNSLIQSGYNQMKPVEREDN